MSDLTIRYVSLDRAVLESEGRACEKTLPVHDICSPEDVGQLQLFFNAFLEQGWAEARVSPREVAGLLGRIQGQLAELLPGSPRRIVVHAPHPEVHQIPWEVLSQASRPMPRIDRVSAKAADLGQPMLEATSMRALVVISRPFVVRDVPIHEIIRPVLEYGALDITVLRPPTFAAFRHALEEARRAEQPYDIVHFDGHGEHGPDGTHLLFEREDIRHDDTRAIERVPAGDVAARIADSGASLVLLNACQSAMASAGSAPHLAQHLSDAGIPSVVAMAYSIEAQAARAFVQAFYGGLLRRDSVSRAVAAGRTAILREARRGLALKESYLPEWVVPVHYVTRELRFRCRRNGRRDRRNAGSLAGLDGRGRELLLFEILRRRQGIVLVSGLAGCGKLGLAKAFGAWLDQTSAAALRPRIVLAPAGAGTLAAGLADLLRHCGEGADLCQAVRQCGDDLARASHHVAQALARTPLFVIWHGCERLFTAASGPLLPTEGNDRVFDALSALSAALLETPSRICLVFDGSTTITRPHLQGLTVMDMSAHDYVQLIQRNPLARRRANRGLLEWRYGQAAGHGATLRAQTSFLWRRPQETRAQGEADRILDTLPPDLVRRAEAFTPVDACLDLTVHGGLVASLYGVEAARALGDCRDALVGRGLLAIPVAQVSAVHPGLPRALRERWRRRDGADFARGYPRLQRKYVEASLEGLSESHAAARTGDPDAASALSELRGAIVGLVLEGAALELYRLVPDALRAFDLVCGDGRHTRYAFPMTAFMLERLRGLGEPSDEHEEAWLVCQLLLAQSCHGYATRLGRPKEARRAFERSIEIAERLRRLDRHEIVGNPEGVFSALDRTLEGKTHGLPDFAAYLDVEVEPAEDDTQRVANLWQEAKALIGRGKYSDAARLLREATGQDMDCLTPKGRVNLLIDLCYAQMCNLDFHAAGSTIAMASRVAGASGDPLLVARVGLQTGTLHLVKVEQRESDGEAALLVRAETAFQRAFEVARTHGESSLSGNCLLELAAVAAHRGNQPREHELAVQALKILEDAKDSAGASRAALRAGQACQSLHRNDEAIEHLSRAVDNARASGQMEIAAWAHRDLVFLHEEWRGDRDEAIAHLIGAYACGHLPHAMQDDIRDASLVLLQPLSHDELARHWRRWSSDPCPLSGAFLQ